MSFLLRGITLLAVFLASPVKLPCSQTDAKAADQATDRAHESWKILHAQYLKYARQMDCDDGSIAEGWSDAVARLLAGAWDQLPVLVRLARADPKFQAFVLRHIDATADTDDLECARINAETRCPEDRNAPVCRAIASAARRAIDERASRSAAPHVAPGTCEGKSKQAP